MVVRKGEKTFPFEFFFNDDNVQWKTPKENALNYIKQENDLDLELLQHEDEFRMINRAKNPPKKFRYKYSKNVDNSSEDDVAFSVRNHKDGNERRRRLIRSSSHSGIKNGETNLLKGKDWSKEDNSETSKKEIVRRKVSSSSKDDNKRNEVRLRNQMEGEIVLFAFVRDKYLNFEAAVLSFLIPLIEFIFPRIFSLFETLRDDFSVVSAEEKSIFDQEIPILNIQQIRCNLIRLGNIINPMLEVGKFGVNILRWKNPAVTLILFVCYMFCVYRGWLINVALLGVICFFSYTFYLSRKSQIFEDEIACSPTLGIGLSIRNQLSISTFVLRRSQRDVKLLCDILEKVKNLILWKQPEITRLIFALLCALTIVSFFLSISELITLIAFGAGIYLFVVVYIFYRFPRLRMKYDKGSQIFEQLMTDAMLMEKRQEEVMKAIQQKNKPLQSNIVKTTLMKPSTSSQKSTPTKKKVHQVPPLVRVRFLEIPLKGWKEGRKTTLLISNFITEELTIGLLFLSENLLTFEPITDSDSKSDIYSLRSITEIEKVDIGGNIPGGGQGIKIRIKNSGKVLTFLFQMDIFSSILDRDAAFSSIVEAGKKKLLNWALIAAFKRN